ncbi:unnamed protein product [Rotaria sp. Silwood2]|nr:unnamed protein product [Rotaria sp. Silwood2]CAF4324689.1 unnamed protein product [Rotaria sp. Silwood2]CAF4381180.1 unnamed protein product [Rotaria sp. Silwood2]
MTVADYDANHWFRDRNDRFYPGQEFSLEIDEILHKKRSKYQDVLVFKSKTYGNVLVLDNCIQCTERDEFVYQEMAAFLPLLAHPCPKRVLIIGGGDGGVLREVIKHPQVEEVVLCEIDQLTEPIDAKLVDQLDTRYYTSDIHRAAFALPAFIWKELR